MQDPLALAHARAVALPHHPRLNPVDPVAAQYWRCLAHDFPCWPIVWSCRGPQAMDTDMYLLYPGRQLTQFQVFTNVRSVAVISFPRPFDFMVLFLQEHLVVRAHGLGSSKFQITQLLAAPLIIVYFMPHPDSTLVCTRCPSICTYVRHCYRNNALHPTLETLPPPRPLAQYLQNCISFSSLHCKHRHNNSC